jgi:hypothetical protein
MNRTTHSRTLRWMALPLLLLLFAGCGKAQAPASTSAPKAAEPQATAPKATDAKESQAKAGEAQKISLVQTYKDEKTGLAVSIPANWTAVPYEGALMALISPATGEDDIFRENVLITHDDAFKNLSLAAYLKALAYDVRQKYPDTQTLESGEIEIGGLQGHWLIDSFTGPKGPAKVYRVVLIKDAAAYVFHGTAPVQTFDRYRPVFETIARSIAWPKPGEKKQ